MELHKPWRLEEFERMSAAELREAIAHGSKHPAMLAMVGYHAGRFELWQKYQEAEAAGMEADMEAALDAWIVAGFAALEVYRICKEPDLFVHYLDAEFHAADGMEHLQQLYQQALVHEAAAKDRLTSPDQE